jgi:hypothetical protein
LLLFFFIPTNLDRTLARELAIDGEIIENNDDSAVATKNKRSIVMLERSLERCTASRAKREELREAVLEMGSDARAAAHTDAAWALVPTTNVEFRLLARKELVQIMTSLTFREPTFGETFWRIPSSLSSKDCQRRLTLLRNAVEDGLTRARGERVQERLNLLPSKVGSKRIRSERGGRGDEEEEMEYTTSSSSSTGKQHKGGQAGSHVLSERNVDRVVTLRSSYGMVVCCAKTGRMTADRFRVGKWELFGFRLRDDGETYQVTTAHQTSIVVGDSSILLRAEHVSAADDLDDCGWEVAYVDFGGHKYSTIRSVTTGKYWRASEEGEVTCDGVNSKDVECMFYVTETQESPGFQGGDGAEGGASSSRNIATAGGGNTTARKSATGGRLKLDESSDDESSDDEFATALLSNRRVVDEEDEEDEETSKVATTKRKRMILSDDDDSD